MITWVFQQNQLSTFGIVGNRMALRALNMRSTPSEEKCEHFHLASSSAGAGLVNMVSNVVLTLSRNQPISRFQSPVLLRSLSELLSKGFPLPTAQR